MTGGSSQFPFPPIYTDLERPAVSGAKEDPESLIKVPEGFFSAEHPNTKLIVNLLNQGDLTRLKVLLDRDIGSHAVFQIADRGYKGASNKSLFHRQAILYLSLIGLSVYFNKGSVVSVVVKEGGAFLLRSQFATGVQSSDDILSYPMEYIAVMMESFDCTVPLLKPKFWNPYETTCLLYRRRYLQSRTPIIGYPDLLRCALLKSANYNLTGFIASAKRESVNFSLSRLIYLGSIMVQHFDVDVAAGKGTRRVFTSADSPRYVMPNLCSVSRRLLTLVAYQDPNCRLLSQVLGALKECAHAGAYLATLPEDTANGSLLLWLQELVTLDHKTSGPFRSIGPATEKLLTRDDYLNLRDNYLRYDALNCISLLLGMLTRHNPAVPDPLGFGRRIMDAASGIAIQAGLADPLLMFAWPDHLLALRSLINPADPGVGFDHFARLLQHIPIYANGFAATSPDMRGADRWRVPVRRSLLRLNWNKADSEMSELMSGGLSVQVATSSSAASNLLVSQEQMADGYQQLMRTGGRNRELFDYPAFYRLFEHRYRMWACCSAQMVEPPERVLEFREDEPFSATYSAANEGEGSSQ